MKLSPNHSLIKDMADDKIEFSERFLEEKAIETFRRNRGFEKKQAIFEKRLFVIRKCSGKVRKESTNLEDNCFGADFMQEEKLDFDFWKKR